MSNHFHLLLETPAGNLSQIMQHINGAYTNYYNTKRRRSGHLFQGRFKALLVDADAYAKELSRYIHLNPVRAGIAATPGVYPWSSFRAYAGESAPPPWLNRNFILGYFGGITIESQTRYRRFVCETTDPPLKSPLDDVVASTFLGGKEFIEKIKSAYLKEKKKDRDLPALNEVSKKPGIEAIVLAAESVFGAATPLSKQATLYVCHRYSGKTLGEIGHYFGIGDSGVSQAGRRFLEKLNKDKKLQNDMEKIIEKINLSRG